MHPDEGTIHAWLDDALDAPEASRIDQHVRGCAECSAAVAEARGLIAGASRIVGSLDDVRGGVLPRATAVKTPSVWSSLRLTPSRAAIAAALLIGVASMFSIRRQGATDLAVPSVPPPRLEASDASAKATPAAKAATTVSVAPTAPTVRAAKPEAGAPRASEVAAAPRQLSDSGVATGSAITGSVAGAASAVAQSAPASSVAPAAGAPPPSLPTANARAEARDVRSVPLAQRSLGLNSVVVTSAAQCIEVVPGADSVWAGFPRRLILDRDSVGQNRVRSASSDGRASETVREATWRSVAAGVTIVVLRPSGAPEVQLAIGPSGALSRATQGGKSGAVEVRRMSCEP